jgi:signal transduction histidine kinase
MTMSTPLSDPASTHAAMPRSAARRWARWASYGLLVVGACVVVALTVRLVSQARSGSIDIDQLMAYAAFLFVGAAGPIVMVLLQSRLSTPLAHATLGRRPALLSPVTACLMLSVGVTAIAWVAYWVGTDFVARSVDRRLQAVATLKNSLVKVWLEDKRDDVTVSIASPAFLKALDDWQASAGNDTGAKERLVDHLWRLSKTSHYVEISLRDPASGALLLTTTGDEDSADIRRQAVAAASASMPVLEDFHVDPDRGRGETPYLGYFAAVTPSAQRGTRVVMHVGIDPAYELFPLIEQWPGTSETAEVLLLRREGDSMRVLNAAHGQRGETRARRLPTRHARSMAAGLLEGRSGFLRGDDDRDQAVLAHAVPVAGPPWFIVAKLGEAEAFAELNRIALLAASIVGALVLLGAWWWVEMRRHAIVQEQHQIERAENVRKLAELARRIVSVQEEERRRWSSELHDRTGANLAAINLNLKAIANSVSLPGPEDEELLTETRELLADTVVSIREFCSVLRPAVLDYAGLVPALETHVAQFARRNAVAARFDHTGFSGRCSGEIESVLFRITQEALMNCARHARARTVSVTLSGTPVRLRLLIEDDGVGFEPARLGQSGDAVGQGLLNMRERAMFAGGTFAIETTPGGGTRVRVELADARAKRAGP